MFRRIYLDNSATTPIDPEVLETMLPFLTDKFGNASSIHFFGQETRAAVDKARHHVAALINARPNEIIFTSGGTEANNLAINGLIESRVSSPTIRAGARVGSPTVREGASPDKTTRGHIITSSIEHPAVKNVCENLEKQGCDVTYLPVYDDGIVRVEDVRAAIRDDTIFISIMAANNEIGTLQPVAEIGRLVRSFREEGRKIWFHTDAVQAVGKVRIDVEEIGCDLLSMSGHKIYAPKGLGALYIRRGVRLQAQNLGGRQERGVRGGTESVPLIAAFGKAAELARHRLDEDGAKLRHFRDEFESKVFETVSDATLNGSKEMRLPNISNISFGGIEGEGLLINLDMQGVAVSTGSACSSGSLEPSPVIRALGRDEDKSRGAIRFSFGRTNSIEDVDHVLAILPKSIENLRRLSPKYRSVPPAVAGG